MPRYWESFKVKCESLVSKLRPHNSVSASQPLQSSQPNSTLVQASFQLADNPFRDKNKLKLDALNDLATEDCEFVKEQLGPNSYLERDAARVETSRGQNQTKRSDQWIISMRKIACQIMQFAPVFDVATNAQADILSLPWAGIRSLLIVAQKTQEQSESILKGIETVLDTGHLLNGYFDIYSQLDATSAIRHLYDNIVKLYGLNLTFVAHAQHTCDMKKFKGMIHSLTGQVIPKFKTDHDGMLRTVEYHARAVDREVSEEQRAWVKQKLNTLEKAQQEINQGVQGVKQALDLSALQAAAGAAYDSMDNRNADENGELQLCLEDTRVQIRREIMHWATANDDQRLFWLSGKAGTGKSTIARTVADELARQGYLVGSFFFKRGHGELGRARSLFPTIARQMADSVPSISHKIAAASKGSPPVIERAPTTQFDTLIQGSLSGYSMGSATDIRAIVIDALDECEDWGAIGHAMTLWPRLRAQSSMNLRVFVTSRSDNKIGDKLSELGQKDLKHERLEHWQSSTIEDDLRLFCYDELRRLREQSRKESSLDELEDDWPGESAVDKLVEISKPLFIAASTIFKEVSNNPRKRLREWVDRLNFTETDTLTVIYSNILIQATKFDKEWLQWFSQVIKPIALLHSPLTIPALGNLLGEGDNNVVLNALKPLSSVIEFPSGKEVKAGSRAAVRVYHESFRDFLMDPNLKGISQFWVNEGETHGILLTRCLDLRKKKLDRDVCKQKESATERKGVSAEDVEKHIPESVQYACRYWVSHAVKSNETLEDGGQVDCFLRTCFLHWTEAMTWLDKLGEMVVCLKQLQKAIDSTESMPNHAESKSSPRLHSFVADALRWVPTNRNMISDTPLQTYLSALAFAPSNSVIRNSFRSSMEEILQVWPPVRSDWGSELQTLRGHGEMILSITPSMDGRQLITVADDSTVRLWDVESGTEEKCLEINVRRDCTVTSAFPEEDVVVIAGLSGEHWRWNLEDDARRIDLKLPSVAESVSVSPNGRFAAWGLDTGEIYIWDTVNDDGQVLEGHDNPVWCLHFSWDSETLVSGSRDIWKWSAQAGHEKICQVGIDIRRITISPNSKFVVFCSAPDTISVFHCTTHEVEQIMQRDKLYRGSCLMVTPDSQNILFFDGSSLFLYDFQTQQEPMKLQLGRGVTAISSLSDGKTIWAGDFSGQIAQLDVDLVLKNPQHPTGDTEVALSTDGRSLALWSEGNQLSVWNLETRICERRRFVVVARTDIPQENLVLIWDIGANELRELEDKPSHVTALALSPDNKTLLCGLGDGEIWAIDVKLGVLRERFAGHTGTICDIAISPDGQNFASATDEKTIRIWGPKSQPPLVLRSENRVSVACFSADGRMLYTCDMGNGICEWDIEKACIVRKLALGHRGGSILVMRKIIKAYSSGSILINSRFVPSKVLHFMDRLAANEADQLQRQVDSSPSTRSTSMFQGLQIWALDPTEQWIVVNGRKILKIPDQLKVYYGWFSCGRTMVFRNEETGFTVLYFTGKVPFR
ncbi:hypothetical protein K470DRAFT_266202 [Piedraia hortae CBS 480.64]|uniref:NACHT domain-containing protein n=1 Tax=Piedraia hortae CBS 480.64 TaxID=1314780 RepID=A0A6A7BSZ4_9PEZI|nr:hypothetical protein K470DRAFT_266202 [Piedraia hortae CBS 480.64]